MEKEFKATIGLEIHAELTTKTKMFCGCENNPDEKNPNTHICPICMGHPGTLPVINKKAVEHVLRVGLAAGGKLADFTEFDRKNYFYPDIPKAYQISQYKYPLVSGGNIKGVEITRIHLEEDTARSSHNNDGRSHIDYNRAGVPLMELVTEPVIHNASDASGFAKELQLLLQYLGAGHANLEKGEMRVEANISVSDIEKFGTKVEVKNLNSFKAVEKAIEFEIERQISLIKSGGKVIQETRGWNEEKEITFSQRVKEDSHDYRYFPDPDLPKLKIGEIEEFSIDNLRKTLPELPNERRMRYENLDIGLSSDDIEIFVSRKSWANFFDQAINNVDSNKERMKLVANMMISELAVIGKDIDIESEQFFGKITPEAIADISKMKIENVLSSRGVKDTLKILFSIGGNPKDIAEKNGFIQKSDLGELTLIVKNILNENSKAVDEFKAGKLQSIQFLVGQGMKATKGSGNPAILKELIEKEIKNL